MNIYSVKAMLSSQATIDRLRKAIFNCNKLGYNCDHVKNSKGKNFLAVRIRDNQLRITTRHNKDITKLIVKTLKG